MKSSIKDGSITISKKMLIVVVITIVAAVLILCLTRTIIHKQNDQWLYIKDSIKWANGTSTEELFEYTFDKWGKVTSMKCTFQDIDEYGNREDSWLKVKYDKNGKRSQGVYYDKEGKETGKTSYVCFNNGKVKKQKIISYIGQSKEIEYKLDQYGNYASYQESLEDGSVQNFKYQYTKYDDDGNGIEWEKYNADTNEKVSSGIADYERASELW